MKKSIIGIPFILVAILSLSACQATSTTREFTIISGELEDSSEKGGFALLGEDITSPGPTIRVRKGDQVTITLNNVHGYAFGEGIRHNFVILPEMEETGDPLWGATTGGDILQWIQSGESGSVTFTPDRAGKFFYICTVSDHLARGMYGSFIVEE